MRLENYCGNVESGKLYAQRENGEGKFVVKVCDLIIIFLISFKNRF